jgi:uncharacterized protein (TIGR02265 family)
MNPAKFDDYRVKPVTMQTHLQAFGLEEDIKFLKTLLPYGYDYLHTPKDYSYSCLVGVTQSILAKCLPQLPAEEAAIIMGRRNYDAMSKTVVGRVAMSIFHLIPTERAIEITINTSNKNIGFGYRKLVKLEMGHFLIECNDEPGTTLPFMLNLGLGLAQRMLETFKVAQPEVVVQVTGPLSYNLELTWKAVP